MEDEKESRCLGPHRASCARHLFNWCHDCWVYWHLGVDWKYPTLNGPRWLLPIV